MSENKNKIDQLHDLLPGHLNTKTNPNWKALIDAIGSVDQNTADLVAEVRQQFFVKTASRPYLDRLAANSMISRPRLVGMDDPSFRQYIPVLSYQPKQVKLIIDQLLDIFFFKESTTAFITSQNAEPFHLQDGWEFEYLVDELNDERVQFNQNEFTDISNATANEIVAAINRQTKYSYAIADYDSISKNTYIKLFTNTIGSKGSVRIVGGRANTAFQFNGFIVTAGNGNNTQWTVTKIGDEATFSYTGGNSPGINQLQVGDIAIIDLPGNVGSFTITNIDLTNQAFKFTNLFATPGVLTQVNSSQTKFLRPNKYVAYLNPRRAMSWETTSGEITVEMPTSPPVVKRSLIGSAHINGAVSQMASRDSDSSMTVDNANNFPNSGTFWLQPVEAIISHFITPSENSINTSTQNTSLVYKVNQYTYSSRTAASTTGSIVEGVAEINVTSVVGIAPGQQVVMDGIPPYAIVKSIFGNIINIDRLATATSSATSVSFLGDQLTGISPNLPALAITNEYNNTSVSRTSNIVSVVVSQSETYNVGDAVIISGNSGILASTTTGDLAGGSNQVTNIANPAGVAPGMLIASTNIPPGTKVLNIVGNTATIDQNATSSAVGATLSFSENLNGGHIIESITTNSYTFRLIGLDGTASTVGTSRIERTGLAASGSKVYITNALDSDTTRIKGPYIWDLSAPFVLSSNTGEIADSIQAGKIIRLLNLGANTIPASGGFLIFDYGLNTQEGPVRYLYKPTDNTIAIDPSYTFKFNHTMNSGITLVETNGPHQMSTLGTEYPPYITDPSQARIILEDLILSVKSAGIFVNFLVHYPEQLYGILDVYNEQGLGAGMPFKS